MKTLGGLQFWTDVRLGWPGYRLQRNLWSGRHRLLDEHNWRRAWGTLDHCLRELERREAAESTADRPDEAVLLVHGIGRTSHCFHRMRQRLRAEGYAPFRWDYPSTRATIPQFLDDLHAAIGCLSWARRLHIVTHSMGGIVLRAYLQRFSLPQLGRVVMLGPPNQGAYLADLLRLNPLFWLLFGPAGQQLTTGDESYIRSLPSPGCEFAVIAGRRGRGRGFNPIIAGDNDGIVELTSTPLAGQSDYAEVAVPHFWMMNSREAIDMTVHFLRAGRLRPQDDAAPTSADRSRADHDAATPSALGER